MNETICFTSVSTFKKFVNKKLITNLIRYIFESGPVRLKASNLSGVF
jgi:hypothetical protein